MDRQWQRVEMGAGAFHNPPRAKYSEETKNLIKLLMEESKVSMMQRKSIQRAMERGESLPPPSRGGTQSKRSKSDCRDHEVRGPSMPRKRTQEMIINSGAYEREQFRRTAPLPNTEKQKRHLACMMAYGKEMPETPHGPRILHRAKREPRLPDNVDPIDELVLAIRERMEFLEDMESLGMGKKYRPIIQQEIAQKLRLIESMDRQKSSAVRKEVQGCEYERPPPKPLPLGDLDHD